MITIKCPRCQVDNLYDAEFCRHCGLRLAKDCPKCNVSNPHQFTYCTQCGSGLESVSVEPILVVKKETEEKPETKEEIITQATEKPQEEPIVAIGAEAKEDSKAEVREEIKAVEKVAAQEETKAEVKEELEIEVARALKEKIKEAVKLTEIETKGNVREEVMQVEEMAITIQVPHRVSTGVAGLDSLIGGGFLAGKIYLVSGESGTGKTVFGLQYLYQGLIEGENGIYISGDEKPSHLIIDAESLGWNFRKYVEERKLGLLDISSHFSGVQAGKTAEVDVLTVIDTLTRHVKDIGAKRIVIDTIAPLVFGQESLTYIRDYTKKLLSSIEDNLECTALITSGILAGSHSLSRYGVEEFIAEGVIILDILKFDGHRVRTLSIRKMRSTLSDLNDHIFEILPQRGIVIKG